MIKHYLYIIVMLCMALVSCGDDGDIKDGGETSNNVNANTTEKSHYATRMEMPKVEKGNNYLLLVKEDGSIGVNFIVEWDCVKRAQRWTCWHWTSQNNFKNWDRNKWDNGATFNGYGGMGDPFQPDMAVPSAYRSELSDYSGYNRGHICASEDRICSQNVNGQTFFLSNMHPQVYNFNGKVWATMEGRVRNWRDAVTRNGGEMFVCKGGTIYDVTFNGKKETGVLVKNPENGRSNEGMRIPVPKYFFMAVLKKTSSGTYAAMAFWAEHKPDDSKDLTPYMITVDELEKRTGYDFFCNLPDNVENSVESILTTSEWR